MVVFESFGKEFAQHKDYSEASAIQIDEEVKRIVTENYKRAETILKKHRNKLKKLADALLETEVLDGIQIDKIIGIIPETPSEAV